jgi:hypothetical protein
MSTTASDRLVTLPPSRKVLDASGSDFDVTEDVSVKRTVKLAASLNQPQLIRDLMRLVPEKFTRDAVLASAANFPAMGAFALDFNVVVVPWLCGSSQTRGLRNDRLAAANGIRNHKCRVQHRTEASLGTGQREDSKKKPWGS